MWIDRFEKE